MICLSQRDDADDAGRKFSERYKGDSFPNHPDPSLLPIVLTRVGTNKKKASKHFFCIGEVETMLPDVGSILCIVPFKNHCNSNCSYMQMGPILATIHSLTTECHEIDKTRGRGTAIFLVNVRGFSEREITILLLRPLYYWQCGRASRVSSR
jgi:hypothetical protein